MKTVFQVQDIAIELTRKKIKNLHLKVSRVDGVVSISAPMRISFKRIYDFALSKLTWIRQHRANIQTKKLFSEKEYITGEQHLFLGKAYELMLESCHHLPSITLNDPHIIFSIQLDYCSQKKKALLDSWYKVQLKEILDTMIEKWEPVMQVKVAHITIRKMKTRWGSCSYKTGKIRFNLELAQYSPHCIEYIVVHEMVHLLEASHNHRFKALMDQFMPEWRLYRQELNKSKDYRSY